MDPFSRGEIDHLISHSLPPLPPRLSAEQSLQLDDYKTRAKQALLKVFVRQWDAVMQVTKWACTVKASFTKEEREMRLVQYFEREEQRQDV